MMQRNRSRAAALLLMAALAACSDAPTGATITAADQPAAFNTSTVPTVSNSGGHPLVTWSAVPGATSYYVSLATYHTREGEYQDRWFHHMGTTTGTSMLDTDRSYTGSYECSYGVYEGHASTEPTTWGAWYEYHVVAFFPGGSSTGRVFAPVAGSDFLTC